MEHRWNTFWKLGDGAEYVLSKFALWGVAGIPVGHDDIQKDLNKQEKWADKKLMKVNNKKCKVLYLGWQNSVHQYMLEPHRWKAVLQKRTCKGQGAMGTNWNTECSLWISKNTLFTVQVTEQVNGLPRISPLGDLQNLSGRRPEQPSLGNPACEREVEPDDLQSSFLFQPQQFCDYMNQNS